MNSTQTKHELAKWYRKLVSVKESRAGLRRLASNVADAISNKNIPANDGANIMWCIWEKLNQPAYLSPFVGLASEYRDYEFLQKYTAREELPQIIHNKVECLNDIINYSIKISSQK